MPLLSRSDCARPISFRRSTRRLDRLKVSPDTTVQGHNFNAGEVAALFACARPSNCPTVLRLGKGAMACPTPCAPSRIAGTEKPPWFSSSGAPPEAARRRPWRLSRAHYAVLLFFSQHSGEPLSTRKTALKTGFCTRTVQQAIDRLNELQLIRTSGGSRTSANRHIVSEEVMGTCATFALRTCATCNQPCTTSRTPNEAETRANSQFAGERI